MHLNILAFAVPLFCGLMLAEYYWSKKKANSLFHFDEVVANLNVGIAERLADLFTNGLFYLFFLWLYKNFAIFTIKPGIITWVLLFLFTDFIWYWYHRFGHTVNLFWSAHVVHHQSEDFNFTISARITVFQSIARCLFWSILPILGFPPGMITLFLLIHGTYPFFTHTQLVGKLGWIEKILVTPSHHRVHHSSNEEYLDKNYGDILIIWDKIFGTFIEEKAEPQYGLTTPINSHSFLWQHFHFPMEMLVAFKEAKGFKQKLKIIFGKPDDIDPGIRTRLEKKFLLINPSKANNAALNRYIKGQTIVTLSLLFIIILFEHYLNSWQLLLGSTYIIVSVINTGAMLEQRKWIIYLEYARLLLVGIFISTYYPNAYIVGLVAAILVLTLAFYKSLRTRYYNYFYSY